MGVDDLLADIYGVKEGAKRPADIIRTESEASFPVEHAARGDHVSVLGLHIHFSRVENESLCRFASKNHHFVLVQLDCGHG